MTYVTFTQASYLSLGRCGGHIHRKRVLKDRQVSIIKGMGYLTFPAFISEAEGIKPKRKSSEHFITTGSTSMLWIQGTVSLKVMIIANRHTWQRRGLFRLWYSTRRTV